MALTFTLHCDPDFVSCYLVHWVRQRRGAGGTFSPEWHHFCQREPQEKVGGSWNTSWNLGRPRLTREGETETPRAATACWRQTRRRAPGFPRTLVTCSTASSSPSLSLIPSSLPPFHCTSVIWGQFHNVEDTRISIIKVLASISYMTTMYYYSRA